MNAIDLGNEESELLLGRCSILLYREMEAGSLADHATLYCVQRNHDRSYMCTWSTKYKVKPLLGAFLVELCIEHLCFIIIIFFFLSFVVCLASPKATHDEYTT